MCVGNTLAGLRSPEAGQPRSGEGNRTWGRVSLPDSGKQISQVFNRRGMRPQSRIAGGWRQANDRSVGRLRDRASKQIYGSRELKIRISYKVVGAAWLDAGLVNNATRIDASIDDVNRDPAVRAIFLH